MIIWFDDALFDGSVRKLDMLALLRQVAQRRHTLSISAAPFPIQGDKPAFSGWRDELPPALQKEVDLLLEKTSLIPSQAVAFANGQRILVSHRTWNLAYAHCVLSVAQALHALAQPLHLLVENQINDGAFINAVLPQDWQNQFAKWIASGQIRFMQGGGITELKKFVEEYAAEDENTLRNYGYPAAIWRFLHFVIYDHDGDSVDKPSPNSLALEQALTDCGMNMHGHRLQKRKQENYYPLSLALSMIKQGSLGREEAENEIKHIYANPAGRAFSNFVFSGTALKQKQDGIAAELEKEKQFTSDQVQTIMDIIKRKIPPRTNSHSMLKKNGFAEHPDTALSGLDADGTHAEMRLLAEKIAAFI